MVPRPFCACSTVFCVCLPCDFCHSRLAFFWSAACFVLFLHAFPTTFVIFLWFGFSFLHVIPTADTSCHSLFLFIVLLHISFYAYPFTQKNLGLCGPDNVDWIKRVLGPICLHLPKPFCQGIVFCGKFVFCGRSIFCYRFAFCCRLLSLALISLDLSCSSVFLGGLSALRFVVDCFHLHLFLWTFLALRSSWWIFQPCFSLGFLPHGLLDMDLQKWASTHSSLKTTREFNLRRGKNLPLLTFTFTLTSSSS